MARKSLVAITLLLLLTLFPVVSAAQTTITFSTDHEQQGEGGYDGYDVVQVSGNVNPPPAAAGSSVTVTTTSPTGMTMYADDEPVTAGTGFFADSILIGCTTAWVQGFYTITVSLNGQSGVTSSTQFQFIVDNPPVDMINITATPSSISSTTSVKLAGDVQACGGSATTTSVTITVSGPNGQVYSGVVQPTGSGQPEDGNYSLVLAPSPTWAVGTYTASVYFSSVSDATGPASASASFVYTGTQTATTSAQTSHSSQSSVSHSSSASTSGSSTSNSGSGGNNLLYAAVGVGVIIILGGAFLGLRTRGKAPKS